MLRSPFGDSQTDCSFLALSTVVANQEYAHKHPSDRSSPCRGTLIQVTGTPFGGFEHDFVRNFGTNDSRTLAKLVKLGPVNIEHITMPPSSEKRRERSRAEP